MCIWELLVKIVHYILLDKVATFYKCTTLSCPFLTFSHLPLYSNNPSSHVLLFVNSDTFSILLRPYLVDTDHSFLAKFWSPWLSYSYHVKHIPYSKTSHFTLFLKYDMKSNLNVYGPPCSVVEFSHGYLSGVLHNSLYQWNERIQCNIPQRNLFVIFKEILEKVECFIFRTHEDQHNHLSSLSRVIRWPNPQDLEMQDR